MAILLLVLLGNRSETQSGESHIPNLNHINLMFFKIVNWKTNFAIYRTCWVMTSRVEVDVTMFRVCVVLLMFTGCAGPAVISVHINLLFLPACRT